MATKTLTDSAIKALEQGQTVWDRQVTGLHVRARSGAKSFFLFYRTKAGIPRRPKIGEWGLLSIGQARIISRQQLASVAAGGDPAADQAAAKVEPTVDAFWERCWREHWSKTKDARNVRRLYSTRIAPRLGNHRVRALCYADVHGLHRALEATPYEANRCLSLLSKLLNLAERHGERVLGSNPCQHVPRYPELSRRRFATRDELVTLGLALDRERVNYPDSAAFIALIVFTGMRPSEVEAGRRERIQGSILRLPDGKTGQRDVYLPPQAVALIEALPAPAKAADGLTPLVGVKYPRVLWERIRPAPDLRLYDLRRTFATVSLAGGTSLSLIGELLGHKTSQTTKIYARLMNEAAVGAVTAAGATMAGLLSPPAAGS